MIINIESVTNHELAVNIQRDGNFDAEDGLWVLLLESAPGGDSLAICQLRPDDIEAIADAIEAWREREGAKVQTVYHY